MLAVAALVSGSAQAGIRCDRDLVQEGDSVAQLLLSCGEPMLRRTVSQPGERSTAPVLEEWTYNFGPGTLLQIVTIEGGTIKSVENGERQ